MSLSRGQLKVLLLQIRQDEKTRHEELDSFAAYSGLERSQFTVLNVFDTPHFAHTVLDGFDALFVGGSSDANVLQPEKYPFVPDCQQLLHEAIRRRLPTFCSCFGHQLAVLALGGQVISDERDYEMGTLPIALAPAASTDPLFCDTLNPFMAVSVHRQRATQVPPGCTLLAYTSACIHSFKLDSAPFWTAQFHPEVSRQVLIERLTLYKAKYTDGDDHLQQVLDSAQETPESNGLLHKFVDRILLAEAAPATTDRRA